MTSLYNVFVSVANDLTEGTLYLDSVSDSSVSDRPDASSGGVGSRCLVSGSGGSSSISRMSSLPFKYEFSIRKKRTAPLKLSSCRELSLQYSGERKGNTPVLGDAWSPDYHPQAGQFVIVWA